MSSPRIRLFVAGMGMRGDGYPNATNTLRILRERLNVDVREYGGWMPEGFHLWTAVRRPRARALMGLLRLCLGNLISAVRLLAVARRNDLVYVPYPSMFLLWQLSWVPRRWRPRCLCDAYITVWDTLFQDRRVGCAAGAISRGLRRVEARALRAAYKVVVDTSANADHVASTYGVPRTSILAFPLAIDERVFGHFPAGTQGESSTPLRVLFIGTFVPLQGTSIIANAIHRLRDRDDLEFVLIGDGQQADEAAPLLDGNPRVRWIRGWIPASALAGELSRADICLGVFGGDGKAARVLAFKLYLALATGKAVITQRPFGLPESVPPLPVLAIVPSADSLADAITALAAEDGKRQMLARAARDYYSQHLGGERLADIWKLHLGLWSSPEQDSDPE